jgi:hypothetical protein
LNIKKVKEIKSFRVLPFGIWRIKHGKKQIKWMIVNIA